MNYLEELKQNLKEGAKISDFFDYVPKNFDINNYSNIETSELQVKSAQASLECFTIIDNPDKEYQDSTTKIDISGLTEYGIYNSINDSNLTVIFSTPLEKRTVLNNWATWSAPPITESDTPPILFSGYNISSLTLYLSKPSCTFGFELDPNLNSFNITSTVKFYSGEELVGTIIKTVTGIPNTAFFAAKTCCSTPFDRIEISIDEPSFGFAIAQVRYSTDCSSECDCCCSVTTPVTIEACKDSATLPLEITELKCTGRLLMVDVTVTACQNRSVIVGVIVCDSIENKVLRFKACEACMPESRDPNIPCVQHTFNFCFVFQEDLCSSLPLSIKTIAEYSSFDFPCNC